MIAPRFIEISPAAVLKNMETAYEAAAGRDLFPAQVENLLLQVFTYANTLLRQGIQSAAEANLLDFASGQHLDLLGRLVSCHRLEGERDDAYRARIPLAAAACSTAGSAQSYRYHALSAGTWMVDAAVTGEPNGVVRISCLTTAGAASSDQLAAVQAVLNGRAVRPINDLPVVVSATPGAFELVVRLTVLQVADQQSVLAAAQASAEALVADRRRRLGADLTLDQIRAALFVPGVYAIDLVSPSASIVAGRDSFCDCSSIRISISGVVDG